MTPLRTLLLGLATAAAFVPTAQRARTLTAPRMLGDLFTSAPTAEDVRQMSPRGVVITGGAGGVGYAYVEEFVKFGHMVVFCDINEALLEAAQKTVTEKYPDVRSRASVACNCKPRQCS